MVGQAAVTIRRRIGAVRKVGAAVAVVRVVTLQAQIEVGVRGAMLLLLGRGCHGPERRLHGGKHAGGAVQRQYKRGAVR